MRDSKQTPLWQFFAILNQLEVFHHYCDSLQASNAYKVALCHCLNSYTVCSSWKYTSHRTQTPAQSRSSLFKALSNTNWEMQMPHKTQFLASWRAAVGWLLAGTSDPKQVYRVFPQPCQLRKVERAMLRCEAGKTWTLVATSIPVSEENT